MRQKLTWAEVNLIHESSIINILSLTDLALSVLDFQNTIQLRQSTFGMQVHYHKRGQYIHQVGETKCYFISDESDVKEVDGRNKINKSHM